MIEDIAAAGYHRWLSMQAVQGHWSKLPERSRTIWRGVAESMIETIREPTHRMRVAAMTAQDTPWDCWDAMIVALAEDHEKVL